MIFKTKEEAYKWFRRYTPFDAKSCTGFESITKMENIKFGDWVLIQHIENDDGVYTISCPIFGVYAGVGFCDQAVVFNFIENQRAWMYSNEIYTNDDGYHDKIYYACDIEVERIILWYDGIHILNSWKTKPSLTELKKSIYEYKK